MPKLSQRNPENLYQKLVAINLEKHLVRKLLALAQVESWVTQAMELPLVITH